MAIIWIIGTIAIFGVIGFAEEIYKKRQVQRKVSERLLRLCSDDLDRYNRY